MLTYFYYMFPLKKERLLEVMKKAYFVVGDTSPDKSKQLIQTWRSLTWVMLG